MANVLVEEQTMTDIANSIREKSGTDVKMKPAEMPQAIREMQVVDTGVGSRQWWLDFCNEKITCEHMFSNSQIETIPSFDTSNKTSFGYMFSRCPLLKTVPPLDTSNGTYFRYMFELCEQLTSIGGLLDLSKSTGNQNMFIRCNSLVEIRFVKNSITLTLAIGSSALLSDESIQSIIDGLADLTGGTAQTITFHSDVKNKLTEEQIASVTSKNWNIA